MVPLSIWNNNPKRKFKNIDLKKSCALLCEWKFREKCRFPYIKEISKICWGYAIDLKFGQDHSIDERSVSWKFHQIPTWLRFFSKFYQYFDQSRAGFVAKLRKVPSHGRISMKFSGNVSFIDTMILSKFHFDCITPTDFGNFLNIGKYAFFAKFWLTEKGATFFEIDIFEFFLRIIVSYTKVVVFLWNEHFRKYTRYNAMEGEDESVSDSFVVYAIVLTSFGKFEVFSEYEFWNA